jgi:hypothetical protein
MRLAAVGLSLLFPVALAEGLVRVFRPQADFFSRSDDRLGMRGIPNKTGWSRDREFTTSVSMNSLGFRDRERSTEKPPGGRRVLVLGDSFTEALQVELEETFHVRLEERLRTDLGPSVDVVAMGLPGVGTAHELLCYEELGERFKPDVVLVCWFSGNDLTDNHPASKFYYPGFLLGPGPDELVPVPARKAIGSEGLLAEIVRRNDSQLLSYLARSLQRRWLIVENEKSVAAAVAQPPPAPAPAVEPSRGSAPPSPVVAPPRFVGFEAEAWEITRRIFKRLRDETAAHGATLVVAMIPPQEELETHPTGAKVAAICRGLGVPSVDLAPSLRQALAARPDLPLYFPRDSHFTKNGHAAVVEPLVRALEPLLATPPH